MKYELVSSFEGKGSSCYDVMLMRDITTHELVVIKVDFLSEEVKITNMLNGLDFVPKFAREESINNLCDKKLAKPGSSSILVMEYIPGDNLEEIIENAEISDIPKIINYLKQLPKLFEQIYNKGIIHGDINWNNIRIDSNNNVYVIDFDNSYYVTDLNVKNNDFEQIIHLYVFAKYCFPDNETIVNLASINIDDIKSYEQLDITVQNICL